MPAMRVITIAPAIRRGLVWNQDIPTIAEACVKPVRFQTTPLRFVLPLPAVICATSYAAHGITKKAMNVHLTTRLIAAVQHARHVVPPL